MKNIKVSLRQKKISKGRISLYLDFYPPILSADGTKTRREFLGLYILDNPTTALDKKNNLETLRIAEQIRILRTNKLAKPEVYSEEESYILERKEKQDSNFVDLFSKLAKSKGKNNPKGAWESSFKFFEKFAGRFVPCKKVNAEYALAFRDFLLNAKSIRWPEQNIKVNTASSYFNKFREVLKYAYLEDYLLKDVRQQIDAIKEVDTEREYLTIEEFKRLVNTPFKDEVLRRACIFSVLTGLRFSDIKQLRWKDVIERENEIIDLKFHHKKTKALDFQPISNDAVKIMGKRGEDTEYVFDGLNYSSNNNNLIREWVKEAKINKHITFHCFRHTYATLLITKGIDIYTISKMLGHKNVKTTQIYAKVIDAKRREAANLINLDL